VGENATARFNSVLLAQEGASIDVGARVYLRAKGSRAEAISKAITTGGTIVARGHFIGEAQGVKAHLECRGLILADGGKIHAIPELEGSVKDVEMTHEAAVGKIAPEEIEYLMARGLTGEEATAAIVRGFLDIEIKGLPESINEEIKRALRAEELEGGF
jgi:Fe-S cluster assembly scaffold protein SufB